MFILFYILIINFFIYKINVFNSKNKIIFFGVCYNSSTRQNKLHITNFSRRVAQEVN
jgi:hypothetical protein